MNERSSFFAESELGKVWSTYCQSKLVVNEEVLHYQSGCCAHCPVERARQAFTGQHVLAHLQIVRMAQLAPDCLTALHNESQTNTVSSPSESDVSP